ncbi:MAG: thiamine phosphate synthase [Candidatus Omnitrophica bacterium]|nr:thiamine phosphate synthase [Candidatus Omnitrophota bacterium]MCF7893831.1 thiamine phosphate synthase [Candidatus Omnitrophota bacterium]
MTLKKKLSSNGLLYLILDKQAADKLNIGIVNLAKKLASSSLDLVQLRVKKNNDFEFLKLAKELSDLFKKNKKIFLVNDRVDIACLAKTDGLHLGKTDIPVAEAKRLLNKDKIIGRTIHHLKELESIDQNSVDYLALGPFYNSKTKQNNRPPLKNNEIKQITAKAKKVLFAIGGINRYNIGSVLKHKIKNVVVSSAILSSPNPFDEIKEIKKCLKKVS